ncbi:MAG: hypothetical protein AB7L90_12330 [Hyphomicrobiaceae bacterium]
MAIFRARHREQGSSLGTIVLVFVVIAGVLGWAIYDGQGDIAVRKVPTETISVPAPASSPN